MIDSIIQASQPMSKAKPGLLDFRKPLYHPDFPFIIFWSPKAGCTTVLKWFFAHVGLLDEALKYNSWVHHYEKEVFKQDKQGYSERLLAALRAGVPAVKFVRDPYARAYSSFLTFSERLALTNSNSWSYRYRRKIIADLVGAEVSPEYTFSFRQYLRWLATQQMDQLDSHMQGQYLARDEYFELRVFKIEQLDQAFSLLSSEYGLRPTERNDPRIFESRHHRVKSSTLNRRQSLALLEFGIPLRKMGDVQFVKFDADLARGTKFDTLVQAVFGKDVELYGYGDASQSDAGSAVGGFVQKDDLSPPRREGTARDTVIAT